MAFRTWDGKVGFSCCVCGKTEYRKPTGQEILRGGVYDLPKGWGPIGYFKLF